MITTPNNHVEVEMTFDSSHPVFDIEFSISKESRQSINVTLSKQAARMLISELQMYINEVDSPAER